MIGVHEDMNNSPANIIRRKPRIALMGEFSAGKSTLSNLLLDAQALPEKVTATRLAPVWISHGDAPAYRETVDGDKFPVSLDNLEGIPVEETRAIRIEMQSDFLQICDLIDFPGISDPNMSPEVWQRMLPEVDMIVWCTHATQAWRQSEAAVWDTMSDAIKAKSLLLVTRFDKLLSEKDRKKVLRRVEIETDGQFLAIYPISLTQALAANNDPVIWNRCGADAFTSGLVEMIMGTPGPSADPHQENIGLSGGKTPISKAERPTIDVSNNLVRRVQSDGPRTTRPT
jgi:hypothetical protein